jgi:hypothetical protein
MNITGHWNSDNVALQAEQSTGSNFSIFLLANSEATAIFNIEQYPYALRSLSPAISLQITREVSEQRGINYNHYVTLNGMSIT